MANQFEISPHPKLESRHIRALQRDKLRNYLRILDSADFEINRTIDIPEEPTFLKVKEFNIHWVKIDNKPGEFINLTLNDVNVLYCHAAQIGNFMIAGDDWLSIPDLVTEFRKSHELSAVIACNVGSYKLPDDLIYPIGNKLPVPCCFRTDEGIVLDAHLAFEHENFRPNFHIPGKYLK